MHVSIDATIPELPCMRIDGSLNGFVPGAVETDLISGLERVHVHLNPDGRRKTPEIHVADQPIPQKHACESTCCGPQQDRHFNGACIQQNDRL